MTKASARGGDERPATERMRAGVGLFPRDDRGFLEIRGEDRVRWLDGMLTQNVKALAQRGDGAGCHALFLTHRGAIVGDLRVAIAGEAILLECGRRELTRVRGELEKRIIADDVVVTDRSAELATLGVEGARSAELLARVLGASSSALPAPGDWRPLELEGARGWIAGFGWSGESAYQVQISPAARDALVARLEAEAQAAGIDCLVGEGDALETLRIEAGIPRQGAELDEDVLPPEARLESAIANNKGCYVGQEIVARLRSRGQVNHLLVGLRLEGEAVAPVGAALVVAGKATGEITSAVVSPTAGPIALAFVRREHAGVGTRVEVAGGGGAVVSELPFVPATSSPPTDRLRS